MRDHPGARFVATRWDFALLLSSGPELKTEDGYEDRMGGWANRRIDFASWTDSEMTSRNCSG